MKGPDILARSLTRPSKKADKHGNFWQYHSRSDRHSKIACWAVLFDLLDCCPLLRDHARVGAVGFGINHEMRDFQTNKKKDLDLVICTPGSEPPRSKTPNTFRKLANHYGVVLTDEEEARVEAFPELRRVSVGTVHLALEAKATMTAHVRALPRLHDELNSSHLTIHGSSDFAIAAGFTMVNMAARFISPDLNKHERGNLPDNVSSHRQPEDTMRTIEKIREIPRRTQSGTVGFDAMGIVILKMVNDGSTVEIVNEPPAPTPGDIFYYDQMVRRIQSSYEGKFGSLLE